MDGLLAELRDIVGNAHVLTDDDVTAGYAIDWTGRFVGRAAAVVRPASTAETASVLAACTRAGIAVVPQGGNTGLVGGSVPLRGEVVLSLRRLDQLGPVDALAAQFTAGAGATLARVHDHADEAGFEFGVDLGARDSATIGGMIATNAGGVRVLRHGHMRAQLAGIEAALADGRVVSHLSGLAKDNTGYDLAGLLAGSEGTLAVVTAARLQLVPKVDHHAVALLWTASATDAVEVAARLVQRLPALDAVEAVFGDAVSLVAAHHGTSPPFGGEDGVLLLVECAERRDPEADLLDAIADLGPLVTEATVASDAAGRARLWAWREGVAEAVAAAGIPHKLDVTLPLHALATFTVEVPGVVTAAAPGARAYLFGHLGDGNVHVNVLGAAPDDDAVDDAVLRLTASFGGSISAEHGIGTAKKRWLHLNRSQVEIDTFRAIKRALDPTGTLNPNALLPDDAR